MTVGRGDYPCCVASAFAAAVARWPDRAAVLSGAETLSYRELDQLSASIAARLSNEGIGRGAVVAICAERGVFPVAVMLGALRIGAAYLPLDPADPADVLGHVHGECEAVLTLVDAAAAIPPHLPGRVLPLQIEALRQGGHSVAAAVTNANDLAYIMYTSGSTGRPKAVLVPHRGILRLVLGCDYVALGPDETLLQLAPLTFDASTFEIYGALLNGGTLVIARPQSPSLAEIADALVRHRVTTAWFTAGLFHLLVEQQLGALAGLRNLLAGGDVLSPSHVARAAAALRQGTLINGYGPTENTTFTCCHVIGPGETVPDPVPIGRPIRGTVVHILDEAMQPVAEGAEGELYAGGEGVALGYARRPDLTAERFVPDVFSGAPGGLLYKTGDRVRRQSDGTIMFLGRVDRQVKVNGKRVELDAVEAALRATGLVADAAVIACTDRLGQKRLRAFASGQAGAPPTAEQLRTALKAALPAHCVPGDITVLDALPLTANGKIDRALIARWTPAEAERTTAGSATGNDTQALLSRIWSKVLDRATVAVDDNFFDLGGTSLQLVEAHGLLAASIRRPPALVDLFSQPTIRSLAAHIDAQGPAPVRADTSGRMAARQAAIARAQQRTSRPERLS